MSPPDRTRLRELQAEHAARGDALGWFEALYSEAAGNTATIPWADRGPSPHLVSSLGSTDLHHQRALVVGCGLGDDAVFVASRGADVTAFDLSPTAVEWCQKRFPQSAVHWTVANLLEAPIEWRQHFGLVVEINTLQALPAADLRPKAIDAVAGFVAPGGRLLVICRARDEDEGVTGPPWPLTLTELNRFSSQGLHQLSVKSVVDTDEEATRRFVATFVRPDAHGRMPVPE
jgi:SAM-dependent methyltransferase